MTEAPRALLFNIYGRFQVAIRREGGAWIAYHLAQGKRARMNECIIPPELGEQELAIYLDDLFHEYAGHGQVVERLDA